MEIHQEEDNFFKGLMRYRTLAHDFIQRHLPPALSARIDFDSLIFCSENFVDSAFRPTASDMVYCARFQHGGMIYFLCEHQSSSDKHMAFRLRKYRNSILQTHRQQYKETVYPVVYPLILYTGTRRWMGEENFYRLFGKEEKLMEEVDKTGGQRIDISTLDDSELAFISLAMKPATHNIEERLDCLLPQLWHFSEKEGKQLIDFVLTFTANNFPKESLSLLEEKALHTLLPHEKESLMTTIAQHWVQQGVEQGVEQGVKQGVEQGVKQGVEQGVKQGVRQGREKERRITAQRLLDLGMSLKDIAQATTLSCAQIEILTRTTSH